MEPSEKVLPFWREISLTQIPFHEPVRGRGALAGCLPLVGGIGVHRQWVLVSWAGPPALPGCQPLFPDSPGYPLLKVVQLLLFVSFPTSAVPLFPADFKLLKDL